RSTNKDLIQREVSFLKKAGKGEFIVAYSGWYEEVEIGIMGLVMQKCVMDLKDWSDAASSFPPTDLDNEMFQISEGIANGLAFLNGLDIIHNDLKPQNIFIDKYGKPYIGDFGVATNRGEALLGYTMPYFDKESLELIPDEKSDSWLLGATLWEFWSEESFNVDEDVFLDDIRNSIIKDILKKLLQPRNKRPSAKQILSLFTTTTIQMAARSVVSSSQIDQNAVLERSTIPSVESASIAGEQRVAPGQSFWKALSHVVDFNPVEVYWLALETADTGTLRSILSEGLVPVDTPKDGQTGLQFACGKNLVDIVKILLEFNADHDRKDTSGRLPIQLTNSVEVWRALGTKMPTPSMDLFKAAKKGFDVTARLILAGKHSSTMSIWAQTPASKLSQRKWMTVRLTERERRYLMPLHVAAFYGHAAVCWIFLEVGADIEGEDSKKNTPLILAAFRGHVDIAQLLLDKVANIEGRNVEGRTPLHEAAENGHVKMVQFLLGKEAQIDCKDKKNQTPLMRAAQRDRLDVVKYLVENGADVGARDEDGKTALDLALTKGCASVADILRQRSGGSSESNRE
ncbi:hypothetical protein HDU96_003945, partial [Phlyctochytrium bullatum]